eukprot:g22426.t1
MKKGANKLRESDPTHDTTEEPPHRKNLLNYPPGDPWYEQNVTAARLEFHPKLEVSRAKTASESRPEIRSEDASFSESGFRPDKSQQTQSLSGYRDEAHCTYPSRDVEKLVEEQPEVAAGAAAWLDGERQRSPERTERQDPQAQVAANAAEPAAEAKVAPEPKLPPNWRSAKDLMPRPSVNQLSVARNANPSGTFRSGLTPEWVHEWHINMGRRAEMSPRSSHRCTQVKELRKPAERSEPSEMRLETSFWHSLKSIGFTFKAGNWVDFFIDQDGVSKYGLRDDTQKQGGDTVLSRKAGGSFYFDAYEHGRHLKHLIFIAGGIGINPIFSMLQEALHDQHELRSLERITLLYSASTADEMAYSCRESASTGSRGDDQREVAHGFGAGRKPGRSMPWIGTFESRNWMRDETRGIPQSARERRANWEQSSASRPQSAAMPNLGSTTCWRPGEHSLLRNSHTGGVFCSNVPNDLRNRAEQI